MEAFGLMLWGLALIALIILMVWGGRAARGKPSRLEQIYLLISWVTLPVAVPLLLVRLSPPPGPAVPAILTILGLLRAMLGVFLAMAGAGLVAFALRQGRFPVWVGVTTLVNLLPFLSLVFPLRF
jgi:hypothetical protein